VIALPKPGLVLVVAQAQFVQAVSGRKSICTRQAERFRHHILRVYPIRPRAVRKTFSLANAPPLPETFRRDVSTGGDVPAERLPVDNGAPPLKRLAFLDRDVTDRGRGFGEVGAKGRA